MRITGETYAMISVKTIADLAHSTPAEAEQWTQEPSFPEPVAHAPGGDLWDRRATEKWLIEHGHKGLEVPAAP